MYIFFKKKCDNKWPPTWGRSLCDSEDKHKEWNHTYHNYGAMPPSKRIIRKFRVTTAIQMLKNVIK
jgi:hypothetical protein